MMQFDGTHLCLMTSTPSHVIFDLESSRIPSLYNTITVACFVVLHFSHVLPSHLLQVLTSFPDVDISYFYPCGGQEQQLSKYFSR